MVKLRGRTFADRHLGPRTARRKTSSKATICFRELGAITAKMAFLELEHGRVCRGSARCHLGAYRLAVAGQEIV